MVRAGDDIRNAPMRMCRQHMPWEGPCRAPVDHICDVCGKEVCTAHVRLARFDPDAPLGRRWLHDAPPPEICITCCVLEASRARERVEDICEGARAAFYTSDEAVGLLGPDELAWLDRQGIRLGPDGRPVPRPR
jgi:hypothetical protein